MAKLYNLFELTHFSNGSSPGNIIYCSSITEHVSTLLITFMRILKIIIF